MELNEPRKPTLLVIDDNLITYSMVERAMRHKRGSAIDLLYAVNGKEGLERARADLPDAILLDWAKPGFDGKYFLREQEGDARLAGIPVLVYSGVDPEYLRSLLVPYPAVKQLIAKPIVPSRLIDLILPYLKGKIWSPGQPTA